MQAFVELAYCSSANTARHTYDKLQTSCTYGLHVVGSFKPHPVWLALLLYGFRVAARGTDGVCCFFLFVRPQAAYLLSQNWVSEFHWLQLSRDTVYNAVGPKVYPGMQLRCCGLRSPTPLLPCAAVGPILPNVLSVQPLRRAKN